MVTATPILTHSKTQFKTIQVFRFVAALMVILYHSTIYAQERLSPLFPRYESGSRGVHLFFAISGFVMIMSSQELINTEGGWKRFFIRRVIRIVPIYWLLTTFKVATLLSASYLVIHNEPVDVLYILKSYFFIPDRSPIGLILPLYSVGWTLNFEMLFYLLFTIAMISKSSPIKLLGTIFAILTILSFYRDPQWPTFLYFYSDQFVLYFLWGMIAAELVNRNFKMRRPIAVPVILASLVVLFLPRSIFDTERFPVLLHLSSFLIVYGAASIESYLASRMPAILISLGTASYSLYLIHPLVAPLPAALIKKLALDIPWIAVILGVIFGLVAGYVFFRFCEDPLTKYLNRAAKRMGLVTAVSSEQ